MLHPRTIQQNIALLVTAWLLSLFVAAIPQLVKQLDSDSNNPINWRPIISQVLTTAGTTIPLLAAAVGLPTLGTEGINTLTQRVGKKKATKILENVATKSDQAVPVATGVSGIDTKELAAHILEEIERKNAQQQSEYVSAPISEKVSNTHM